MKSRKWITLLLVGLLVLSLAACVRSISGTTSQEAESSETTAGEVTGGEAASGTTNDVMAQLEQFVTQTAAAASGTSGESVNGEATPVPGEEAAPADTEATAAPGEAGVEPTPGEAGAAPVTGDTGAQPTPEGGAAAPESGTSGDQTQTGQSTGTGPYPAPGETGDAGAGAQSPAAGSSGGQAAVVVPTATPGIPKSYTLKTGEWLTCIARRFNVNQTELASLNGVGNLVFAGMVLKIPQTGNPFVGPRSLQAHPTTYTVQSGDNVYSISCQFGDASPEAIAYANQLSEPFRVSVGQQLYIP